jgi:HAMP domain
VLGTLVLVLSPATVSARPLLSEVIVLSIGLAVIVLPNGVLLRSVLRPLDRLTAVMAAIDLRHPGRRLDEHGSGPARALVRGFNAMHERLEFERTTSTARALHAQEAERQRIAAVATSWSSGSPTTESAAPTPLSAPASRACTNGRRWSGGRLEVRTRKGAGTEVALEVPIAGEPT